MSQNIETLTMGAEEAAENLGVCTKVVYDLARTDGFPAVRIGRKVRISRAGLAQWVESQRQDLRKVDMYETGK